MIYTAFIFSVSAADSYSTDLLIALLDDMGFEGITEEDGSLIGSIPEGQVNPLFVEKLEKNLSTTGWHTGYTTKQIPEQNWNSVWEKNYEPVVIPGRCVVRAHFHPEFKDFPIQIIITPKMSFGTGHHQTTRLMMEQILDTKMQGKRVLDMGCGTGVLGILSSLCGASDVTALDIQEESVKNTRENAELNKIRNLKVITGDKDSIPGDSYDIILSNITRNVLKDHMTSYAKKSYPGSILLISGFLLSDVSEMKTVGDRSGFSFISYKILDLWVMMMFSRK